MLPPPVGMEAIVGARDPPIGVAQFEQNLAVGSISFPQFAQNGMLCFHLRRDHFEFGGIFEHANFETDFLELLT